MADTVDITEGVGTTIATDDCGASGHTQIVKLAYSGDGVATPITADADGLEVQVAKGTITAVTTVGTVTNVVHVDDNSSTLSIDDGGGTITVDGTVTATVQPQRKTGAWHTCHYETSAATNHEIKAAPGAGTALYIVSVVYNSSAAGTMKLIDGSGGASLVQLPGMAANGGASMYFGVETALKLTDATALCLTTTDSGNHAVTVTGYTA